MTSIQTQRLTLLPLSLPQLHLYLEGVPLLAQSLGLVAEPIQVVPDFWAMVPEAMAHYSIPKVAEHHDQYEWYTHWLIVFENRIAGGTGLSGLPNELGEVQTGYFVDERYYNRGIATEATMGLCDWAFQHPGVKAVIAYTLADGFASQRVLQKCGFELQGKNEEGELAWRLSKPKN
ncbi:MAG: GNAT family N-acetyltransferase [Saprospiraceae bacterium]|nr:GNAT family N-acetyltransferase [Saprospiraceae bacterium]